MDGYYNWYTHDFLTGKWKFVYIKDIGCNDLNLRQDPAFRYQVDVDVGTVAGIEQGIKRIELV